MAHSVESQTSTPANALRNLLGEAERVSVKPNAQSVESLLVSLDQIDQMFAQLTASGMDLRAEEGRWDGLRSRLQNKPGLIARPAAQAGGLAAMRLRNPPATEFWWHLDTLQRQQTQQMWRRTLSTIVITLVVVVGGLWSFERLFPPDPQAVLIQNVNNQLDQLILTQDWAAGVTLVEKTLQTLPDDPELLVWLMVLHEQLGNNQEAATILEIVQRQLPDKIAELWNLVGNRRFQVGNAAGAETAAQTVLALAPDDPQAHFLLGSLAEARGDVPTAIQYFDQVFELSQAENPALAVTARMRMGMLMQQGAFSTNTMTETNTLTETNVFTSADD